MAYDCTSLVCGIFLLLISLPVSFYVILINAPQLSSKLTKKKITGA